LNAVDLLAERMPNAKKRIIKDTAHLPSMEKPEEFNREALDFLQSLEHHK